MTSLVIRTRADRVVAHRELGLSCLFEAKTTRNKRIAIEALPLLAHHLSPADCLYAVQKKDQNGSILCEAGFWASQLPPAECLWIPTRFRRSHPGLYYQLTNYLMRQWARIGVTDVPEMDVNGSGDPFVLFEPRVITETCDHWRTLIDHWVDRATRADQRVQDFQSATTVSVKRVS